jgi:hypothetical protein
MINACTIDNNHNRHSALMQKSIHLSNQAETISLPIHAMVEAAKMLLLWMHPGHAHPATSQGRRAEAARARPAGIHFAGSWAAKPRNHGGSPPRRQRHLEIRVRIPWPDRPLEEASTTSAGRGSQRSPFRLKHAGKAMLARLRG